MPQLEKPHTLLKHRSRQRPAEEIRQSFDHDGGLIIDDFVDPHALQKFKERVPTAAGNHGRHSRFTDTG